MKKLTNYKQGNKGGYGGCLVWFIPIVSMLIISCSRKMNLQTSKISVDSTIYHKYDSVVEVSKTQSEAYESLLQAANSTGVVFESQPCDSGKIGGSGMPHIINKVTVAPDGTKTFEGAIKSYKDESSFWQTKAFEISSSYDSLSKSTDSLQVKYNKLQQEKNKVVKVVAFPWWLIACGIIFFLLWANERFSIFKIPIITRTTLFKAKNSSMKVLLFLLTALMSLSGCAKFHDSNTSIWSEIWFIPWIAGLVSAFAWYKAITIKKKVGKWDKWYVFLGIVLPIGIIAMIIGVYGSR